MPLTRANTRVDTPLSNYVLEYGAKRDLSRMVTRLKVENETDKYFVWDQQQRRVNAVKRADASVSASVDFGLVLASFAQNEYAVHTTLGARMLRTAHQATKLQQRTAMSLEQLISLEYEAQIFSLLTTDANFATGHTTTLANPWSNTSLGDPITDVQTAKTRILTSCGGSLPAGVKLKLCMGVDTWAVLRDHPQFTDRLKYTDSKQVTPDYAAALFEVDEIVVSYASLNETVETPDTPPNPKNNTLLWPSTTDQAVLACVADSLGGAAPGVGDFTAYAALSSFLPAVRRWTNDEELGNQAGAAEFIEASDFWEFKIIAVDTIASGKSVGAYQIKNTL